MSAWHTTNSFPYDTYWKEEIDLVQSNYKLLLRMSDVSAEHFPAGFQSTGVYNEGNINANTYSIIGNFDKDHYQDSDGNYEFLLINGNTDGTRDVIHWKQSSWLTDANIIGYETINVPSQPNPWVPGQFKGLGLSDRPLSSYLDGNGGSEYWWNSVGAMTTFNDGFPGFNLHIGKSQSLFIIEPNLTLLLRMKDVTTELFPSTFKDTGVLNENDPSADTYSIIGDFNADDYKDNEGNYEFILINDNIDGTRDRLQWKQSSWLTESNIIGYVPIDVPSQSGVWEPAQFKGLARSDSYENTYLDGNGNVNYWWNSVGAMTIFNTGFPGFSLHIGKSQSLYIVGVNEASQSITGFFNDDYDGYDIDNHSVIFGGISKYTGLIFIVALFSLVANVVLIYRYYCWKQSSNKIKFKQVYMDSTDDETKDIM